MNLTVLHRKFTSLLKYRDCFRDWPRAALMRYAKQRSAEPTRLQLRRGGGLWLRPRFDTVAMGEIFVAESYAELFPAVPPRVVWDIGGNIGCFAVWLLERHPATRVTSFEPCSETFAILQKNRTEHPDWKWEIRPFGLAHSDMQVTAFVPFNSYGETSRHAQTGVPTTLPLRNIASVWEEEGRPSLDLMKIDCEGDEYEILETMPPDFFASVQNIILEIHPRTDRNEASLKKLLIDRGYQLRIGKINPSLWLAGRDLANT